MSHKESVDTREGAKTQDIETLYMTGLRPLWPSLPSWAAVQTLHAIGMDPYHPEYFGGVPGYGPLLVRVNGTHYVDHRSRVRLIEHIPALATWWASGTVWCVSWRR